MADTPKPATDEERTRWASDARILGIVRPSSGHYVTDKSVVRKLLALNARIDELERENSELRNWIGARQSEALDL